MLAVKNGPEPVVAPPSSDLAFEDDLLQLHLPDPDLPVREDAWPSSDPEDIFIDNCASPIPDNWTDCQLQSDDMGANYWVEGMGVDVDVLLEVNMDRDGMLVDVEMDDGAMEANFVTGMHLVSKEHGLDADFNSPKMMITS